MATGKSSAKGFSLLEVLVAVAILTGGILTVLGAISFSIRVGALSAARMEACLRAEDHLSEARFMESKNRLPESEDQILTDGRGARFSLSPLPESSGSQKLHQLTLDVYWKSSGHEERLRFTELFRHDEALP